MSKSWVTKQGGWDGNCANAEKYHDPKVEQSELFKVANGTGPYKLDRWAAGEQDLDLSATTTTGSKNRCGRAAPQVLPRSKTS